MSRAWSLVLLQACLVAAQQFASRLPTFQVPRHYALFIRPEFDLVNEEFPYFGEVAIHLELTEATDRVILHEFEIERTFAVLCRESTDECAEPVDVAHDDELQQTMFIFDAALQPADDYVLAIEFNAELRADLFGFYRARHDGANGSEWIASTQFASVHARKAFPCFDEPTLKATFQVNLIGCQETMLGNMPAAAEGVFDPVYAPFLRAHAHSEVPPIYQRIEAARAASSENNSNRGLQRLGGVRRKSQQQCGEDELRIVELEPTPVMYTGILVWVFCDYESTDVLFTERGVPVQAWAPRGLTPLTIHSRDVAARTLDHFEQRFEIDYPLPKLDLIAIPEFFFGAMENWGLVTFSTGSFLIDSAVDSTARRDSVTRTVSHEIAHSWFGNTITMKWWNDTWLNEGFATFIAPFGVDAVFPEWKELDSFAFQQDRAFVVDALRSSHAINIPFDTPAEQNNVYTTQAYQKGGSVLEMISKRMGRLEDGDAPDSPFWRAMVEYFNRFAFGNTDADDLFDTLADFVTDPTFDVHAVQSSWILRPGYPIVEVEEVAGGLRLRQSRFLSEVASKKTHQCREPSEDLELTTHFVDGERVVQLSDHESLNQQQDQPYYIPITFRSQRNQSAVQFLEMADEDAFLPSVQPAGWLKLDADASGLYRVRYGDALWRRIVTELVQSDFSDSSLQQPPFTTNDRAGLLRDAFTYATLPIEHELAGLQSITQALDISVYLLAAQETEYTPWFFALRGLMELSNRLSDRVHYHAFDDFVARLLGDVIAFVGFDEVDSGERPEEHARALLRMAVHEAAVYFRVNLIYTDTVTRLEQHLITDEPLHPDLATTVWNGGATFDFFFYDVVAVAQDSSSPSQQRASNALSYYRNGLIIQRYLEMMFNGSLPLSIPSIERLVQNNLGTVQVLQNVQRNWDQLCRQWCDNLGSIRRVFTALLGRLSSRNERDGVRAFFEAPDRYMGETDIARCEYAAQLETIERNIVWMDEIGERVFEHIAALEALM